MALPIQLFGEEELRFADHTRERCSACLAASSPCASLGHLGCWALPFWRQAFSSAVPSFSQAEVASDQPQTLFQWIVFGIYCLIMAGAERWLCRGHAGLPPCAPAALGVCAAWEGKSGERRQGCFAGCLLPSFPACRSTRACKESFCLTTSRFHYSIFNVGSVCQTPFILHFRFQYVSFSEHHPFSFTEGLSALRLV